MTTTYPKLSYVCYAFESEFTDICSILIQRKLATPNKIFYLNYVDAVSDFVNSGLKLTATTNEVKEVEKNQVNITTHNNDYSVGKITVGDKNQSLSITQEIKTNASTTQSTVAKIGIIIGILLGLTGVVWYIWDIVKRTNAGQ